MKGSHLLPSECPGSIQAARLPLAMVNLLGMHIIPPLTINVGIHFTYPQKDGELSQPPVRLGWEQVLNPGPVARWSAALPTELSWLDKFGYIETYYCLCNERSDNQVGWRYKTSQALMRKRMGSLG